MFNQYQYNIKQYNLQLNQKSQFIKNIFSKYYSKEYEIFNSPYKNFRMRTEFSIINQNNNIYYAMHQNNNKIKIINFPIASKIINQIMKKIISLCNNNNVLKKNLFQINFLSTLNNDMAVTLCYHKKLDYNWKYEATQIANELNINVIGRAKKQKIIIKNDYVIEKFILQNKLYFFIQPEGTFSQPNAYINKKMINWLLNNINNQNHDLIEMFCGYGNFTIPLANKFNNIFANEINKTSIKALNKNIILNNTKNITCSKLSANETTLALNKYRSFNRLKNINLNKFNFNTILVDPPRAGLDNNTCNFIKNFDNIIYISCNPNTLIQNINNLLNTHIIQKIAIFDQFPYTNHIETSVILQKK